MLEGLVLATPTYNSLEYLNVFLESYHRYASSYKLVVVSDGSEDGTNEVMSKIEGDITFIDLGTNFGQPKAYNTCMLSAKNLGAKYIFMLNDDMVFGPGWDSSLENYSAFLETNGFVSINLAWPGPDGYKMVSYPQGGQIPTKFDFGSWELFCDSYVDTRDFLPPEEFGPGFPFILSSKLVGDYLFDPVYAFGGCLDTDFLFSLWLGGVKLRRISGGLLFHFSGGSTDKQKESGVWVKHAETFTKKWGIGIGDAMQLIEETGTLSPETIENLRGLNDKRRY